MSLMALFPTHQMAIQILAQCQACQGRLKLVSLRLVLPKVVVQVRSWLSGLQKGQLNGICGHVTRVASQAMQMSLMRLPKVWKFMAMNMPCISHSMNGQQVVIKSYRLCMRHSKPMAASWALIMAGSVRITLPKRAMIHRTKPHKHGHAKAHGKCASKKRLRPFVMALACSIWQGFLAITSQVQVQLIG